VGDKSFRALARARILPYGTTFYLRSRKREEGMKGGFILGYMK
jgi:hypothetical protein